MEQEYILCSKEGFIRNISYGITLDYGIFPKMFSDSGQNLLFQKNLNIDSISEEFNEKNDELKDFGGTILFQPRLLKDIIERENLQTEEYNFFLKHSRTVKIFV